MSPHSLIIYRIKSQIYFAVNMMGLYSGFIPYEMSTGQYPRSRSTGQLNINFFTGLVSPHTFLIHVLADDHFGRCPYFFMSGLRILHILKDWWKFIQIHQYYTMALKLNVCRFFSFDHTKFKISHKRIIDWLCFILPIGRIVNHN